MAYLQQAKNSNAEVQIGSLESIRERALDMSQLLVALQSDISSEAYETIAQHLEGIETATCDQLDALIAKLTDSEGIDFPREAQ